jgi:hypothetical protein
LKLPHIRDEKEELNYFNILKELPLLKIDLKTLLHTHKALLRGIKDKIAGKIKKYRCRCGK